MTRRGVTKFATFVMALVAVGIGLYNLHNVSTIQPLKSKTIYEGTIARVIFVGEDHDSSYQIHLALERNGVEKFDEYNFDPSELYKIKVDDQVVKFGNRWLKVKAIAKMVSDEGVTLQVANTCRWECFMKGDYMVFTRKGLVRGRM